MKLIIFVLGVILTFSVAGMSFYPVFQDFNEIDYEIPFHKSDDFPNERDLLIMNVYADCNFSDNVFSQFLINDEPICTVAQNWVSSLLFLLMIGIVIMIIGSLLPTKIQKSQDS